MLKKTLMTDISMKYDTDLHLDKVMQTYDLNAFHRYDNWTPTEKKEDNLFHRFAFLKISCNRTLHTFAFALPHKAYPSHKAKECNLANAKKRF